MATQENVLLDESRFLSDASGRVYEVDLVRQVDRVRAALCIFLLIMAFAAPTGVITNTAVTFTAVALAALFTIWTLFFLNWQALWENQKVHIVGTVILLADVTWLSLFIYGTGGYHSPFKPLLLLAVIFAGAFLGGPRLALPIVATLVAVLHVVLGGSAITTTGAIWQTACEIISVIALAWLVYGIARVAERERRANESVVKNLSEGVVLLDKNKRIILLNPQMEQMCDIPADTVVGDSLEEISDDAAYQQLRKILNDVKSFSGDDGVISSEVAIDSPQKKDLRVVTIPLGTNPNKPMGWVVVGQDVTTVKAEAVSDEDRTSNIPVPSGELRRPLASLRAIAQVLLQLSENVTPEHRDRVKWAIETETNRLLNLVSRLMDVTAVETGQYQMQMQPVQVEQLIDRIRRTFRVKARLQGIRFETNVEEHIPQISADAGRLEQMMSHLCENALQYTAEGGTVEVRATADNGKIQLSVHDTGCGIPEDEIRDIFDKFEGGDIGTDTAGSRQSMGLGLYFAHLIARQHNGTIDVESTVGEGSTFRVTLPTSARDRTEDRTASRVSQTTT